MAQAMTQVDRSSAIIEGFSGLTIIRQVGLMLGLAASVAIGMGVVLWSKEPDLIPLYHDINYQDANQIVGILTSEAIHYKIDTDNNLVLVERDKVHQARLRLAAAGLSSGQSLGYDLLDQKSQLGTSQFMEKAKYHRSIEGELAKTIMSIQVVRGARVHIAIPKKTVFLSDQRRPSASVLIELVPGRSLEKAQVEAVTNLVASSVPELSHKSVTIIDQQGNLLSDPKGEDDIRMATRHLEYVKTLEKKYMGRVQNILGPILGEDQFKVELTADVDFTRQSKTAEVFNPDSEAIRSEQVLDEQQYQSIADQGVPGALNNQPPAPAEQVEEEGAEMNEPSNSRMQRSRNFELDRTISYVEQSVGALKRLSVAVVVDDKRVSNASAAEGQEAESGEVTKEPYSEEELARITALVKDAIGFDVNRGDRVIVVNQPFMQKTIEAFEPLPEASIFEANWFKPLMKQVVGGVLILVLVFGLLKPILNILAKQGQSTLAINETLQVEEPMLEEEEVEAPVEETEILLPGPGESYEAQLNAVKNMVADDPRRVAQVVKTWLAKEG